MSHRSWVTQHIANRLPPWSDARRLPHSFVQQFLNPTGELLEELGQWSINQRKNLFLGTANTDMPDVSYVVRLPSDFQFGQDPYSVNAVRYIVPTCKGYIGSDEVWIELAENNTFDDLWYDALPSRVTFSGAYVNLYSVLDETELGDLDDATFGTVVWPTRLAITIANGESFADLARREPFSFIIISGTTIRDIEEEETIFIPYNGMFLTRKIWKEVTEVVYYGVSPSTATIQIDCFTFNKDNFF